MVLNGAMGVDKVKYVNGVRIELLRFICIFVPINAFLRRLQGDSGLLPYIGQLGLTVLEEDEAFWVDSEDMESCFKLFYMPSEWLGMFAFEKQVPLSAFGGDPNVMTYVGMRAVPMGWVGAVDVMQYMARKLVFHTAAVSPICELRKDKAVPSEDIAIVCMDGYDHLSKVKILLDGLAEDPAGEGRSEAMDRFVAVCAAQGVPLNAGKSLVRGLRAGVLGGEIDGLRGRFLHSRDNSLKLCMTVASTSDASESGGGAAEATTFVCPLASEQAERREALSAAPAEEPILDQPAESRPCSSCGRCMPARGEWAACPLEVYPNDLCRVYAGAVLEAIGEIGLVALPPRPSERASWVARSLAATARRLRAGLAHSETILALERMLAKVGQVQGMAAVAVIRGWDRTAAALLIGFACLLRSGEVVSIVKRQFTVLGGGAAGLLPLTGSKGAKRLGQVEHVTLYDPLIIQFLIQVLAALGDFDPLFPGGFAALKQQIVGLAKFFGLQSPNLTPYCLRRGGATWHLTT
ncbi:unnamed protein product [Prorocentrum cordatum]|uniref:Uncharacterized protein n=1 Tax=Prorocentrum cordatum TaxID=2364126 RepID=A0ABN9T945_9DINO|nr:unnamed protein product [Polarella glacialis]